MKIVIQNIGSKVTTHSLSAIFSTYGHVETIQFGPTDLTAADNRTAYAEMPDEIEGALAIAELNGCWVDGKRLLVNGEQSKVRPATNRWYQRLQLALLMPGKF